VKALFSKLAAVLICAVLALTAAAPAEAASEKSEKRVTVVITSLNGKKIDLDAKIAVCKPRTCKTVTIETRKAKLITTVKVRSARVFALSVISPKRFRVRIFIDRKKVFDEKSVWAKRDDGRSWNRSYKYANR
jgi:hypothetical protein